MRLSQQPGIVCASADLKKMPDAHWPQSDVCLAGYNSCDLLEDMTPRHHLPSPSQSDENDVTICHCIKGAAETAACRYLVAGRRLQSIRRQKGSGRIWSLLYQR